MTLRVRYYDELEALPDYYEPFFADIEDRNSLFDQREWFAYQMHYGWRTGNTLRLCTVEEGNPAVPLLLLPLRYTRGDRAIYRAHTLASISHLENYAPTSVLVAAQAAGRRRELLTVLFRELRDGNPASPFGKVDVVRLCPFEPGTSLAEDLVQGLDAAGFRTQTYLNSGNLYQHTEGMRFADYFAQRSASQRYSVRRKQRKLEREGKLAFRIVKDSSDPDALEDAIDDYGLVAIHSWKPVASNVSPPILNFIRLAADRGALRLGILRWNDYPIAAQFWVFSAGVAGVIRANYHSRFAEYGAGVVLSAMMIESLLDDDQAAALDFGYGEEDYKGKWVSSLRNYHGVLAFNPTTRRGIYHGFRHIQGRRVKNYLRHSRELLSASIDP